MHRGTPPQQFARALASISDQTLRPRELVVVEDGPLDREHHEVIHGFALEGTRVTVVRLRSNGGPGVANQAGLMSASSTWIAKADADDVCLPGRFRAQLDALSASGSDLCGSAMLEFDGAEDNVVAIRRAPTTHADILRRVRLNNPINHPTAMYRREAAMAAGGYPDWRFAEDYALVARMLSNGARMMNLAEPLVLFRAGDSQVSRRRSSEVRGGELRLQQALRDLRLVSTPRMVANLGLRVGFTILPARLAGTVARRVLASPVRDSETGQRFPHMSEPEGRTGQ